MADWVCGDCGKEFDSNTACAQHRAATGHFFAHLELEETDCRWCGKSFSTAYSASQHEDDCEEAKKILAELCDFCGCEPCDC